LVKTITIRDEVYRKLLSVKRENESFSELLDKLVEGADSLEILKRLRSTVEFKDKEKMISEIYASRAEHRV
jgi:predicted CopG family antitoxin